MVIGKCRMSAKRQAASAGVSNKFKLISETILISSSGLFGIKKVNTL